MAKKKSLLFFFTFTHTNYLFQRRQHLTLSSLPIFSKAATLYSLLLGYLLEGSNTLLSLSPVFLPNENIFSLLVSCFIFPLLIGRTLRPKPSNSLQHCLFIRLFCYFLLNQEYITSLTRNLFPLKLGIHYLFNKE